MLEHCHINQDKDLITITIPDTNLPMPTFSALWPDKEGRHIFNGKNLRYTEVLVNIHKHYNCILEIIGAL